jgi:hypothetical protein
MLLLAGCSTKFIYPTPEAKSADSKGLILAYKAVEDQRSDRKIDEIYENKNPLGDIDKVIEEEIRSTGLFEKVVLIPGNQGDDAAYLRENNIGLLMTPSLKELKWQVPNYDAKMAGAFAVSILTGLVGGFIYGSIPTDVYGDTTMKVVLKDLNTGETLVEKDYTGHCSERKAMISCDSPKTKATAVGNSLKIIMDQFKGDLIEAVNKKSEAQQMMSEVGSDDPRNDKLPVVR